MASHNSQPNSPQRPRESYNPFDPPLDVPELVQYTYTPSNWDPTRPFRDAVPEAHPFPSPGLPTPGSRSASPGEERRTSYFGRAARGSGGSGESRGSYAAISGADVPYNPRTARPDSIDARSFRTMGTEFTQFPQDMHTQLLAEKRSREIANWHVHWTTPFWMGGLYVAGFLAAIGHHVFYQSLDGKPADNQLLMVRIGTAFAFFVRAMFVASVIFCYRQRIWVTFRHKALTLGAIDSLFAATEDLLVFFNWEMWRNAKIAVAMALAVWLIPVASVLSPASLTTEVDTAPMDSVCPIVSSLDFSQESEYNYRLREQFPGYSLAFYNTTDNDAKKPGWFDYYDQPSKNARRLATISAYLKRPSHNDNEAAKCCGSGFNCTYTLNFKGPGYKCEEIANGSNPNDDQLKRVGAPFNISALAPVEHVIYIANVDAGEYANPQLPTNDHGVPQDPDSNSNLGILMTEPVLWIGYAVETSHSWPANSPYANDPHWSSGVVEPKIIRCEHYEVQYRVQMDYTDGAQAAHVTKRDFLAPIINTTLPAGAVYATDAQPVENWVRPNVDVKKYKLTTVYHAFGSLLRSFLRGMIEDEGNYILTKSDISETRLTNGQTAYPVTDLQDQLQSFYEDMILSLLSEPHLVVATNASVPCKKMRSQIVYLYKAQGLWVGYALVAFVSGISLAIGSWSLYTNGVSSDTLFSRIMVTTRNPTLDQLSVGACLGSDPFPKELRKTRLRFGVIRPRQLDTPFEMMNPEDKIEHVGFGTIEEITPLRKGDKYA